MKKILFVCYMDLDSKGTLGIKKKVISQLDAFNNEKITDLHYVWREANKLKTNIKTINSRKKIDGADSINRILLNTDLSSYDVAYIRFNRFSFRFYRLLRKLKRNNVSVLVEIPTYPYDKEDVLELKMSLKNKKIVLSVKVFIKIISNIFFSVFVKKYISRVVTYSNDDKIWGVKCINISNGIEIKEYNRKKKNDTNNINLICVSSCLKWHGYDRLINGLKNYYKKNNNRKVFLYIVGEGPESSNYKQLIKKYNLQEYIYVVGSKYGNDLMKLYEKADIAFDALGRHRVGVFFNSSLKGKEYTERGLPIVSGVETEFDKEKKYKFYYRIAADESDVNIDNVLKFYDDVSKIPDFNEIIREYAINNFSYKNTMKPVIEFIKLQ